MKECVLTKGGLRIRLQDQPFQVLAVLLAHPGEVVTRDEIRRKLWSAETFVEFDDGLNNAIKKLRTALNDAADNPRFIETVPRRGYRFLAPVDFPTATPSPQTDPNSRSLISTGMTEHLILATRDRVVVEQTDSRRLRRGMAVATILLLGAGGIAFFHGGQRWRSPKRDGSGMAAAYPVRQRRSVAVLGFRNLSGRPADDWLSTALSEMLNTELAVGEKLRMISGEQVSRAKLDLRLPEADTLAKDSLAQLRTNLAADHVILGSYTTLDDSGKGRIRLDLRVQDATLGETVVEEAVTGSEVDLFEIVSDAGARMRARLGVGAVSSGEAAQVRASLPANPGAARLYAEGLAKLRVFDAQGARDLLTRAVNADPGYPLAHSALASAWSDLGYDTKARQEAKLAFDRSAILSPEETSWVEGAYRETTNEWSRVLEVYRGLWNNFPDNLDYGLKLALAQVSADRGKEALVTVASLRNLPIPAGADPRIDLAEALAADALGDFKHRQQAAATAAGKAQAQQAGLVLAEAREQEGWAWVQLGEYDRSLPLLQQSKALYLAGGNRRGAAAVTCKIGDVIAQKGDLEGARKVFEGAVATCRSLGSLRCLARSMSALANVLDTQGKPEEARKYYEQVIPIDNEIGNKAAIATNQNNLGDVLDDLGDLGGARKMLEEALATTTAIGDKYRMASESYNLGELTLEQGDLAGSQKRFEQAAQIDQEIGYKRGAAFASAGLGKVLFEQDKLEEARKMQQDATSRWQALGDREHIAESWTQAAALLLEGDRAAEAEKLTRDAVHQFESAHANNEAASAYALMCQALLMQGDLPAAQAKAAAATSFAEKTGVHPP